MAPAGCPEPGPAAAPAGRPCGEGPRYPGREYMRVRDRRGMSQPRRGSRPLWGMAEKTQGAADLG